MREHAQNAHSKETLEAKVSRLEQMGENARREAGI